MDDQSKLPSRLMYVSEKNIVLSGVAVITYLVLEVFSGLYFLSCAGVALFVAVTIKFIRDIGHHIGIRDVIAFIATLQWIIGPVMAYHLLPEHELYFMSVPEKTYMNYVVPGCLAFVAAMYLPLSRRNTIGQKALNTLEEFVQDRKSLGYILIGAGIAFSFLARFVPGSLAFLFFLLSNMQFAGLFIILFADRTVNKWIVFAGVLGAMTLNSIALGMFHELIIWYLFTFLILAVILKLGHGIKILLFTAGLLALLLIQSIKQEYREKTWYSVSNKSNTEIFQEILLDRLINPAKLFEPEVVSNAGARLNQGWIISRVMEHIPEKQSFAKGETIKQAFYASILPRFLAPGKATAGGQDNFERFTGLQLRGGTSMNISIIGEAYGNYGIWGGMVFMLLLGLVYNLVLIAVVHLSNKNPTLILWVPLLFFQVIKAETDFAIVINHLVKSAIMIWLVFWFSRRILKVNM